MPTSPHYDVVVTGARPAGAATALLLARQGARVLLLDRSRYGTDTLSTHALLRGAVLLLHRWGVLPAVIAAGTPAVRSVTFHLPDAVSTVPIRARDGVDALYAPRRTVLDAILADAARRAGADVRFGVSVTDLTRGPDGRVTGVTAREGGQSHPIGADLVVGADGRRSTVARLTGARTVHVAPASSTIIYRYFRGIRASGYHWYYAAGSAAGVIPTNDNLACVFAATSAGRLPPQPATTPGRLPHQPGATRGRLPPQPGATPGARLRHVLAATSPELAGQLADACPASPARVFPGLTGYLRQAAGPGWALVGDAGYFKDPITAHGITDALRDAHLLAGALARGGPGAVRSYQAERDELSLRLFRVTGRIAAFDWTADGIGDLLLELKEALAEEVTALTGTCQPLELAPALTGSRQPLELASALTGARQPLELAPTQAGAARCVIR